MALTKQDKAFIIGVIEGTQISLKLDSDRKFEAMKIEMKELERRLTAQIEKAFFDSEKRIIEATGEILYDHETRLRKLETSLLK